MSPCRRVTRRQLHLEERCLFQRQKQPYRHSQVTKLQVTSRTMGTILLDTGGQREEGSSPLSKPCSSTPSSVSTPAHPWKTPTAGKNPTNNRNEQNKPCPPPVSTTLSQAPLAPFPDTQIPKGKAQSQPSRCQSASAPQDQDTRGDRTPSPARHGAGGTRHPERPQNAHPAPAPTPLRLCVPGTCARPGLPGRGGGAAAPGAFYRPCPAPPCPARPGPRGIPRGCSAASPLAQPRFTCPGGGLGCAERSCEPRGRAGAGAGWAGKGERGGGSGDRRLVPPPSLGSPGWSRPGERSGFVLARCFLLW